MKAEKRLVSFCAYIYLVVIKSLQSLKCNYKYRNDVNSLLTNQTFNKKNGYQKRDYMIPVMPFIKKKLAKMMMWIKLNSENTNVNNFSHIFLNFCIHNRCIKFKGNLPKHSRHKKKWFRFVNIYKVYRFFCETRPKSFLFINNISIFEK